MSTLDHLNNLCHKESKSLGVQSTSERSSETQSPGATLKPQGGLSVWSLNVGWIGGRGSTYSGASHGQSVWTLGEPQLAVNQFGIGKETYLCPDKLFPDPGTPLGAEVTPPGVCTETLWKAQSTIRPYANKLAK